MALGINTKKIAIGFIALIFFSVGLYTGVLAGSYSGTVYGRAAYHGYFDNNADYYGEEVLPAVSGGQAIPSKINTVKELIAFLKAANNSSNSQRKTGSAFIVNTMLGRNAPGEGGKSVSTADWNELEDRLNTYDINWSGNVSDSINSYKQGSHNDDAFYSDYRNESGIKISDGGKVLYKIIRRCANPIGNEGGMPKIDKWVMTPTSAVTSIVDSAGNNIGSITQAKPDDTITWKHTAKNTGTDATDQKVYYDYLNSQGLGSGNGSDWSIASGLGAKKSRSQTSTYKVKSGDIGKNLCRATRVWPKSWQSNATKISEADCVLVANAHVDEFSLMPDINITSSDIIEAGADVNMTMSVENDGPDTSTPANWSLTRVPAVGSSLPSGNKQFTMGSNDLGGYTDSDTASFAVGAKVCYVLTVAPQANDNPNPISDQDCITIGKKPKVQVWGGDLNVRGNVTTSTSVKSGRTFGSWAEYGIVASGGIIGAASGAAYAGPGPSSPNILSFANADNTGCGTTAVGCYVSTGTMPDVAAQFPNAGTPIGSPFVPNSRGSGIYSAGNIMLNTSSLSAGKTIIIKSTGTVTIAGNQTYHNGPYTNINQLPQMVIIARNIIINDDVTQVDAWLVATNGGSIKTCGDTARSANQCSQQLTVNGPIMTDKLYLYRTAGSNSGAASGDPAEVFNLRADVYLWAQAQSISNSKVKTVHITELPPRF